MDNIDHFLANLHFISDDEFLFAVPLGTPADLRARLFAAWKSYGRDITSMDETLERNSKAWDFDKEDRTELQVFVDEIVLPARIEIFRAIDRFSSAGKGRYPKTGQFAAGMALTRLNTTFTVLSLLTRYGYGFEGASVARLVLEQLAWAYAIRDREDTSLLEVMPQKSISEVREILPWAGRLYGILSEYAHIKPALGSEYVEVSAESVAVYSRRPAYWSPILAWCYALLADGFVVIAETVLPIDNPTAIKMENGKVELLPARPIAQLLVKANPYAPFDSNKS